MDGMGRGWEGGSGKRERRERNDSWLTATLEHTRRTRAGLSACLPALQPSSYSKATDCERFSLPNFVCLQSFAEGKIVAGFHTMQTECVKLRGVAPLLCVSPGVSLRVNIVLHCIVLYCHGVKLCVSYLAVCSLQLLVFLSLLPLLLFIVSIHFPLPQPCLQRWIPNFHHSVSSQFVKHVQQSARLFLLFFLCHVSHRSPDRRRVWIVSTRDRINWRTRHRRGFS